MFFLENRDAKLSNSSNEGVSHSEEVQNSKEKRENKICPVSREEQKKQSKKFTDFINSAAARAAGKAAAKTTARRREKPEPKEPSAVVEAEVLKPAAVRYTKPERWKTRIWRELKPQLLTGAISLALVIGLCVGVNVSEFRLGYEVLVDGETLGLVIGQEQVEEAIDQVRDEVQQYMGKDTVYTKEPVYIRRIVSGKDVTSVEEMKNRLLANVNYMVECCGIFINGQAMAGLTTEDAAKWVLDQYKAQFVDSGAIELASIDFCEQVETKHDFLHIGLLRTPEEVLAMLDGALNTPSVTYTTTNDDTLWGISEAYGVPVEKIQELNPDIQEETLTGGIQLALAQPVPLLTVRTVQTVSSNETIPREVQQIEDDTLYQDVTEVAQEGEDGEAHVIAKITKINNAEQSREVLSSETVRAPIAKIERIGTKELPPTTGSGSFLKPAFGSLSSRFGGRWGRHHNGIDIAGSTGSDILAADGGVVTYAGWMSGYGNYVVINHENGYETAYGHNSSIVVSVGDRVAKGDVIAKMGNTGNSTGPHCHFEVKLNGEFQDPLQFVTY